MKSNINKSGEQEIQTDLTKATDEFERKSQFDSLTNLPNTRNLAEELQRWIARVSGDRSFVCAIFDIQGLREINDVHGHQTGDFLLTKAADVIRGMLGPTDFAARYAGDQFVVLLENTTARAKAQIEELLAGLAKRVFEYNGKQIQLTFRCGLVECTRNDSPEDLLGRAGVNLAQAKQGGKNKVFFRSTAPDQKTDAVRAVVRAGRIEPVEELHVPDGTEVLVTILPKGDDFWLTASESSLKAIWDNSEDDVYAELLER